MLLRLDPVSVLIFAPARPDRGEANCDLSEESGHTVRRRPHSLVSTLIASVRHETFRNICISIAQVGTTRVHADGSQLMSGPLVSACIAPKHICA